MKKTVTRINLEYSLLQFLYWAAVCAANGFASIYLLDKGFSNSQIGITVAIGNVLGVILQPLFASIADKTDKVSIHKLTAIQIAIGASCFLMINFVHSLLIAIGALFIISTTLYQTTLPLINSISVYYTNKGINVNFGLSRSMGSVSFAITSTILGIINEKYGCSLIFLIGFSLYIIAIFVLLSMPVIKSNNNKTFEKNNTTSSRENQLENQYNNEPENKPKNKSAKNISIYEFILRYKNFCICLIGIMFIFVFHNMLNAYMIHAVRNLGGNSSHMGVAISIAAFSELPAMALFSKIRKHFKISSLIVFSCFAFTVKAIFTAISGNIFSLYLVQLIQAVSFAIYTPASIYFVNEIMNEHDKFKGQAVITAFVTAAAVIGSLFGGIIIDNFGVKTMLYFGAALSTLGTVIVAIFAPRACKVQS